MASPERLAYLRYRILDACLFIPVHSESEEPIPPVPSHRWSKLELLDEVNAQLRSVNPHLKPIAMRTMEKDFFDMERLFGVKIAKTYEGKKPHYHYAKPGMSIASVNLSQAESAHVQGFLDVMKRYRDQMGWEWWNESEARLRNGLGFVDTRNEHGIHPVIMDAEITRKHAQWFAKAMEFMQRGSLVRMALDAKDNGVERYAMVIERMLKQQGDWLLLGHAWDAEGREYYPLIVRLNDVRSMEAAIGETTGSWPTIGLLNWDSFISKRMHLTPGVIKSNDDLVETIRIWMDADLGQLFLLDPFHNSQDMRIEQAASGFIFTMHLVPDESFVQAILRWGKRAQVLEPAELRHQLRLETQKMSAQYQPMFGP